jgi:hypothetical protein
VDIASLVEGEKDATMEITKMIDYPENFWTAPAGGNEDFTGYGSGWSKNVFACSTEGTGKCRRAEGFYSGTGYGCSTEDRFHLNKMIDYRV